MRMVVDTDTDDRARFYLSEAELDTLSSISRATNDYRFGLIDKSMLWKVLSTKEACNIISTFYEVEIVNKPVLADCEIVLPDTHEKYRDMFTKSRYIYNLFGEMIKYYIINDNPPNEWIKSEMSKYSYTDKLQYVPEGRYIFNLYHCTKFWPSISLGVYE